MQPSPPKTSPLLDSLLAAATADGLTPVVLDEDTVDLRIVRDGRVQASIRVWIDGDQASFEAPARPGTAPLMGGGFVQPWADGEFEQRHMRDLDMWWSRVPGSGRTWAPTAFPWARPGYWRSRLDRDIGTCPYQGSL